MNTLPIEKFEPRTLSRDWGEEIIVAHTPTYLGKVLRMYPGTKGGLQYHVDKEETFHLFMGRATVRYDDGTGLRTVQMRAGESYHVPKGAVHQVEAVTYCVFFEASTPHFEDRVRCEDRYGEVSTGGLPTTR